MGHALDCTLQDILTRFKRMQGYEALWLPGSDHAGIATQIKVEEELRKNEGLTRYDLGREKFLERVWAWKEKYGSRIVEQQKKMGASCDWSRDRFTMDEGCSRAVRETFCELYEKGLIYKGSRIINWCPHCLTALSDAEVEYTDKPGNLWYIRYPLADGSGDIVIATTRPETMLGDSGVCVNPADERYKSIVGKTVILPLVGKEIPVVADSYAEMEFGTGCVEGIAAPEAGNNGDTSGALVPMLTLGVPGDATAAVLIGALTLQGLQPGPQLFTEHMDIVNRIFASTLVANFLFLVLGLLGVRLFIKVIQIKPYILTPIIFVLCILGSYALRNNMFDVGAMLLIAVVGYFFLKLEIPIAPIVLALILGPLAESNLRRSLLLSQGSASIFFTRPICIFFLVLALVSLCWPLLRKLLSGRKKQA